MTSQDSSQSLLDWGSSFSQESGFSQESSFSQESTMSNSSPLKEPDLLSNFVEQYKLLAPTARAEFDGLWGAEWMTEPRKLCCELDPYAFFRVCFIVRESLTALEAWAAIPRPGEFTSEVHQLDGKVDVKASWRRGSVTNSTEVRLKDVYGYVDPPALMHTLWPFDYRPGVAPTSFQASSLPYSRESSGIQSLGGGGSWGDLGGFIVTPQISLNSIIAPQTPGLVARTGSYGIPRSDTLQTIKPCDESRAETQGPKKLGPSNTQLTSNDHGWGHTSSFLSQESTHGRWRRSGSQDGDTNGTPELTSVVALTGVECGLLDTALSRISTSQSVVELQDNTAKNSAGSVLSDVERWVLQGETF